ncbi:MAG TPA: hypothetical protein VFT50_02025 [Baekduia sp.]|nr:hypothetical protein [Baekduia sp.]
METRLSAAKTALIATALLAVVLVAMAVLNAPWLGFVAIGLLFAALIAREVTVFGGRGFLVVTGVLLGVIAIAFAVQRLS